MSTATKPRQFAVALEYKNKEELPGVLAAGFHGLAQSIVAIAEANGIPVTKHEGLMPGTGEFVPGTAIPEDSFQLVAEVVSFLYWCDERWRERHDFLAPLLAAKECTKNQKL